MQTLFSIIALSLCIGSAVAQDREFDLTGADYWEIVFDGGTDTKSAAGYQLAVSDAAGGDLFNFVVRDAGESADIMLDTSALGTSVTQIRAFTADGGTVDIDVDPTQSLQIAIAAAQRRWCNPLVGCRFEFWRSRRAVEQSFTFAALVPIVVAGRTVEARKLIFISDLLEATVEFGVVKFSSTDNGQIRIRDQIRRMPPMRFDGLVHSVPNGTTATERNGVLDIEPLKDGDDLAVTVNTATPVSAWGSRLSFALTEIGGGAGQGNLLIEAQSRFSDLSLATISALDAQLADDGSDRRLTLSAAFDSDTFRLVALNGRDVVADLGGLASGVATVQIANLGCHNVPEFFENCSTYTFRTLPQHNDACAWTVQLPEPLTVTITGAAQPTSMQVSTLILMEEEHDDNVGGAGDHARPPMTFTTIRLSGEGLDRISLFDQVVRAAH